MTLAAHRAYARAIDAHASDVSCWASGERPTPMHQCVAIERATGGNVTRKDLHPKDWLLIWPELADARRTKKAKTT